MDCETKPSKTEEDETSVLGVIRERLRPLFLKKFRLSRLSARELVVAEGMTEAEAELFMAGFSRGWLKGALDASAISSRDLHPAQESDSPLSDVH